jgi:endonuclease/exonuclease/phosphatase (EEP) superfamily protein YafD
MHFIVWFATSYGETPSKERMPVKSRFALLVLITLAIGLLAPSPWFAAKRVGAVEPGPGIASAPATLAVASLNIAKVTEIELMAREIEQDALLRTADAVLLQETVKLSSGELSSGEMLAKRLGRVAAFASPDEGKTFTGLAILSLRPLRDVRVRQLKNVNLVFRTRKRIALAATVDTPYGPVRIINVHLDTRINPKERLEQLGPALEEAAAFAGPVIIGGDFNTNDMQWVSHVVPVPYPGWQAAAVRKLMTEKGFSTPFELRRATFDHLRMQLDWLFTNRLPALRYSIQPIDFSDHHAIWAEFDLDETRQ